MLCLDFSLKISAAFDKIDHDLLLADLFHIGIRGNALGLLSSYLRGRHIMVQSLRVTLVQRGLSCLVLHKGPCSDPYFLLYIGSIYLQLRFVSDIL